MTQIIGIGTDIIECLRIAQMIQAQEDDGDSIKSERLAQHLLAASETVAAMPYAGYVAGVSIQRATASA